MGVDCTPPYSRQAWGRLYLGGGLLDQRGSKRQTRRTSGTFSETDALPRDESNREEVTLSAAGDSWFLKQCVKTKQFQDDVFLQMMLLLTHAA